MKYTPELGEKVCERIGAGGLLAGVFKARDMPSRSTFYRWIGLHRELRDRYHAALEQRADAKVMEIEALEERLKGESDLGRIRAIETAIRSKQWQASRMGRAQWGDRQAVDIESKQTLVVFRNYTGLEVDPETGEIVKGQGRTGLPLPPPEELIGQRVRPDTKEQPVVDTEFVPERKALPARDTQQPKPVPKKKPRLSRLEGGKIVGTPLIREKPRRPRTAVFD